METKKQYYILLNVETQQYELIDCTNHDFQPVVKTFKYKTAAHNYKNKLLKSNI